MSQTENVCEIKYWASSKLKKFGIRNEIRERGAVTEGKGPNSFTKQKTGGCFPCNANRFCLRGESFISLFFDICMLRGTTHKKVENTRDRVPGQPWAAPQAWKKGQGACILVDRKCENKRSRSQEVAPATGTKSSVYGSNV